MKKGLFFSLPSVSVDRTLTPVLDEIAVSGMDVICYNTTAFRPSATHRYEFRPYPSCFAGEYSASIHEKTSYFQLAGLLADAAECLMEFLLEEIEREKPDIILHSHLAFWAGLAARHFNLPAVTFNTTFILDRRIMLPFFRRMNTPGQTGFDNVRDMIAFYRKAQSLFSRLGLKGSPDAWDVYINKGQLNIAFIREVFQPERHLFGRRYHYPGYPGYAIGETRQKTLIYVAMGTIVNKERDFYLLCIRVLTQLGYPAVISVGYTVDIAQLPPVPDHIRIVPHADQRTILPEALLFISRGGMASVHEAIQCLTPLIVVPMIPEQRITAETISRLGIGVTLAPETLTDESLAAAIATLLDQKDVFRRTLSALRSAGPGIPPEKKAARLIEAFLDTPSPADNDSVVALFRRQAHRHPHATAVRHKDETLTYEELDERSDRLARLLHEYGIHPDEAIPVLLSPGLAIVVTILGILKAGGAYVPLDPQYPADRIRLILDDIGPRMSVTGDTIRANPIREGRLITLSADGRLSDREGSSPPELPAPPADGLAYILYTSGSTGRPKGVLVGHDQLQTYIKDVYERLELEECESFAVLGTFSADAGLTAVFCALCHGKLLDIADIRQFEHFGRLSGHFQKYPVDCYKITPSLMEWVLRQEGYPAPFPGKKLLLGGEACPLALAQRLLGQLPETCRLYNHYGPTETTIGVITYAFPRKTEDLPPVVPLGIPLPSVKVWVMDGTGVPVAHGEVGELYIEGPLVARGYLHDTALTAEKFIVGDGDAPSRVYRTGDFVRYLADGNIEFLGRRDDQIKLRGHRIELSEITQAIAASGMIRQCDVLAKKDRTGADYLAAYIQPEKGFDQKSLSTFLDARLPVYMIPSRWVVVDDWPMTFNNKTDRRSLPDPEQLPEASIDSPAVYADIEPVTDTEMTLISLWESILAMKVKSKDLDFFSSGGDSLRLLQLARDIDERFSVEMHPSLLFRYRTIRAQADLVSSLVATAQQTIKDPGRTEAEDEVTPAQRNLYLQYRLNPSRTFAGASLSFRLHGPVDDQRLEASLNVLVQRHESLRASYRLEKGRVCKRISAGLSVNLERVTARSNDADKELTSFTGAFDPGRPPLVRAFILDLPDGRSFFHLSMPHINSDGESLRILLAELETVYNDGSPAVAPPSFTEFQRHQQAYLQSESCRKDRAYWTDRLAATLPRLRWGQGTFDPAATGYDATSTVTPFPMELTSRLRDHCRKCSTTPFSLLLATQFLLLHQLSVAATTGEAATGEAADGLFSVCIPVHNRNWKGADSIVGLLANVIPVIVEIRSSSRLDDWLKSYHRSLTAALEHDRYPFEYLQEIYAAAGHDRRGMMQSFFGYHPRMAAYRFGKALFKPYFPATARENLALSAAVFDTGVRSFLRCSTASKIGASEGPEEWTGRYFQLLGRLLGSGPQDTVADLESCSETLLIKSK